MRLKIVFMGTPDFAVEVLAAIAHSPHQIVGVVTNVDKPAGRGKQLRSSAVKNYAIANNLPLLQPPNLKAPEFVEQLQMLEADLFVVVAFRMLPKIVWEIPPKGTINLHASLLPNYRGAAPINWAIIHGERESGVTTFFINEEIDTGAMLLQKNIGLTARETAGSLHDKLAKIGGELVVDTLLAIENGVTPQPQNVTGSEKSAPKLNKSNTRIDWNQPIETIDAIIRGLSPYPVAWTTLEDNRKQAPIKIYQARIEKCEHSHTPQQLLIENRELKVVHREGFLILEVLQLPNKRKMTAAELLNGWRSSPSARLI